MLDAYLKSESGVSANETFLLQTKKPMGDNFSLFL